MKLSLPISLGVSIGGSVSNLSHASLPSPPANFTYADIIGSPTTLPSSGVNASCSGDFISTPALVSNIGGIDISI
jgi:hypothetical protein